MAKKRNKNTISKMTQTRGAMPPPTVKDEIKKRKNDRKDTKRKLKQGNYDEI